MKQLIPLATVLLLLIPGCADRISYDIEEVAPAGFLSGEEEHDHDTCTVAEHDHDHEEDLAAHDSLTLTETYDLGLHQHGTGVRNHGTQWFFNQPWAASFVWGKMLRDSIILLMLATSLFLLPRFRKKRK